MEHRVPHNSIVSRMASYAIWISEDGQYAKLVLIQRRYLCYHFPDPVLDRRYEKNHRLGRIYETCRFESVADLYST